MKIGIIADLFELPGRGVAVITDARYEQLPADLRVKVGDPIELRRGSVVLKTRIVGIEHCDPWSPKQTFSFLLPLDVRKADVTIGSEVWSF